MGSLAWMAPEVLVHPKKFTQKSDVYSYGIILWELFAKKNPCPSALPHVTFAYKVINESWRPSPPQTCPIEWRNLIEQCWAQSPSKRPAFKTIIELYKGWAENPPEIKPPSGESSEDWDISQPTEEDTSGSEFQTLSQSNTDYDDVIN